ncbi:SHOCT domain-containing protein [Sporomusa sphaeroides DSM 2875]|uniref:SHOCT domain-containing protein n=1 Tax=Sporomusa sphaeroides TaxID=47679 RepID=UPI0020301A8B|nr:SHOCT domain-containing protein [Sporomusa sphaeroides]MCM0759562.1 SHOCT domain-containing protein [Sporomusa sphaeroides DSM 2875]
MYYWGYSTGGSYLGSLLSMLASLLFWGLVIVGFAYLIRWAWDLAGEKFGQPRPVTNSLEIVKRRYANGELSRDEYLAISEELRSL